MAVICNDLASKWRWNEPTWPRAFGSSDYEGLTLSLLKPFRSPQRSCTSECRACVSFVRAVLLKRGKLRCRT